MNNINFFKRVTLKILKHLHYNRLKYIKKIYSIILGNYKINFIDVGASIQIIQRWKKIDTKNLIYHLFEPNKSEVKKLLNNKLFYSHYNINDFGLSNKKETRKLFITKGIYQSSFLKPNLHFLKKFKDVNRYKINKIDQVKAKKLDQVEIKKPDFIKIDVQGFNYQILEGAEKTLKNSIGIDIEVDFQEIYKKEFLFGKIDEFLSLKNFEFIDFTYLSRWERNEFNGNGQCIFGNALFLKKSEIVEKYSKEQLVKYLTIAILYNKFDLAELALSNSTKIQNKNKYFNAINRIKKISDKADKIKSISNGFVKLFDLDYNMHLFK
jgi:FkbM family methyltransferase